MERLSGMQSQSSFANATTRPDHVCERAITAPGGRSELFGIQRQNGVVTKAMSRQDVMLREDAKSGAL